MSNNLQPWDRQPGETARMYDLFLMYRDLPTQERTAQKVAEKAKFGQQYVHRLCHKNHWVPRVKAWQDHQQRIEDEEMIAARKAHVRRVAKLGLALQEAGAKKLPTLRRKLCQPRDITQVIRTGAELERKALGLDHKTDDDRPKIQVNLFTDIQMNVAAKLAVLKEEMIARLLAAKAAGEVIEALPAPATHNATCQGTMPPAPEFSPGE
jgi:hypothetical protein